MGHTVHSSKCVGGLEKSRLACSRRESSSVRHGVIISVGSCFLFCSFGIVYSMQRMSSSSSTKEVQSVVLQ